MAPTDTRQEPFLSSRFVVTIDGRADDGFSRVVLPGCRLELVDYREGGGTKVTTQLIGNPSYGTLLLERGVGSSRVLADWFREARDRGPGYKKDVVIALHNENNDVLCRWKVIGAIPVSYAFTPLVAGPGELLTETLEAACGKMERDTV